jgi:glycerol-3-phosphate acyltransferase PlsY
MEVLVFVLFGYLLGSVPTGHLLAKLAGVDIRSVGSGNVGATNVARSVGKWQGALTLIADAAKGALPPAAANYWGVDSLGTALAALAAFLGHLYPVFLKFRGGKGVATGVGSLLAIAPPATAVMIAVFALVAFSSRLVSLASMVAAAAAPFILWLFDAPWPFIVLGCILAVLVLWRHRANIARLKAGTEPRFSLH